MISQNTWCRKVNSGNGLRYNDRFEDIHLGQNKKMRNPSGGASSVLDLLNFMTLPSYQRGNIEQIDGYEELDLWREF